MQRLQNAPSFDDPTPSFLSSLSNLGPFLQPLPYSVISASHLPRLTIVKMSKPLDYQSLLSDSARNRMPSAIRSLFPAELIPGMVSLLSGKPNSDTFPFQRILLELKPEVGNTGKVETVSIEGSDLDIALQYSATSGLPKLVDWMENFQSKVHRRERVKEGKRAGEVWRCSFGNGSQDLLTKAFEALVNEGDSVLLESPAYS